jgi:hypothetical protein
MSKMIVTSLRRTAVKKDTFRLVVTKADGTEVTLKTPIQKLNLGTAYRKLGGIKPIEQYGFQIGKRQVERFDQATAAVLGRHNAILAADADVPAYAKRAAEHMSN